MSSTRTSWALLYYHYEYYNTPASVGATFRLPCHVNPIELLGSWCWKSSPRERMYSLGPFLKSINSNPTTRFVYRVWRRNLPPTCFRHLMSRPGFSFFQYSTFPRLFVTAQLLSLVSFWSDLAGWSYYEGREIYGWLLLLLCVWLVHSANAVAACPWTWVMDTGKLYLFFLNEGLQWSPNVTCVVVQSCKVFC